MTISELFLTTILRLYNNREADGLILEICDEKRKAIEDKQKLVDSLISGDRFNSFEIIIQLNAYNMDPEERKNI